MYLLYIFVHIKIIRKSALPDKIIRMRRPLLLSLIILLIGGMNTTCKKDKGEPPVLPPYASMVIDFSNFTTFKKSLPEDGFFKGTENSTWEFAAGLAGIWYTLISSNIQVPLDAFEAASGYKPVYVSENLWQWSYGFTSGTAGYKAKLKGKVSTGSVAWKMYITDETTGGFTDYLWIEGTAKSDGSGGQWFFRQSPASDVQIFQEDWTRSGDVVTSVKYTYTKSDSNNGSYITYTVLSSSQFDSAYHIHFADGSYADSDIEWNSVTMDGRLKCLDYLQDQNWYCWDTNKINKICD